METLASFEKIAELGTQKVRKFNDVFLVRNKFTGELGVLKHIVKSEKNEHLIHLLRNEAEISFTETGLPQTLAFAENKLDSVLIRKYYSGIPLNEYWKSVKKSARIEVIFQLISGLQPIFEALNQQQLVHCDIKPSNILIDDRDGKFEVHLIDYGLAIRKNAFEPRKTLFALGFAAPELILNKLGMVSSATDIFALGITCWYLLTGKLPLTHENPGIMTNLQITHPLPTNKAIPKDVMRILQKMCAKHAFRLPPNLLSPEEVESSLSTAMQQRYQNLSEVVADFSECKLTTSSNFNWKKIFSKELK